MINLTKGGNGYKQETKILDYGTAAEFFCIFTLGDKAGFSGRIRVPRWQQIYRERKLESFISCQLFLAFVRLEWCTKVLAVLSHNDIIETEENMFSSLQM